MSELVLFSGGVDSLVVAGLFPNASLLTVDYGQERQELAAAAKVAR